MIQGCALMNRFLLFVICQLSVVLCLVFAAPLARAQGPGTGGGRSYSINEKGQEVAKGQEAATSSTVSAATMNLLKAIETAHKDLKCVHAKFFQTRMDVVMDKKTDSPGELWFERPAHYRCDYSQPDPMIVLINNNTFYQYVKEIKQVDFYKFASDEERDQNLHQLLIVFGFNPAELAQLYEIRSSEDDPALKAELVKQKLDVGRYFSFFVKPRAAYEESCPFKTLKVTIDKARYEPQKIEYKDARTDSDLTLTINKIEYPASIPETTFNKDLLFPKGTEYIDRRNAQ